MSAVFKIHKVRPETNLLLVKGLPLQRVTINFQVLGEGSAAVGDGQVGKVVLEGNGICVLVQQRPHNGHQLGERLRTTNVCIFHYTFWPQGSAKLVQQEADLLPAQTQHSLEETVELQISHLTHLMMSHNNFSQEKNSSQTKHVT